MNTIFGMAVLLLTAASLILADNLVQFSVNNVVADSIKFDYTKEFLQKQTIKVKLVAMPTGKTRLIMIPDLYTTLSSCVQHDFDVSNWSSGIVCFLFDILLTLI
jgi:hypothetical protein